MYHVFEDVKECILCVYCTVGDGRVVDAFAVVGTCCCCGRGAGGEGGI